RPEFGPTLPELIGRRFSVSRRAVAIGGVVALILAAVVIKVVVDDGRDKFVVHGKPSYNVLYDPALLHRVTPQGDEQMRLVGKRPHVSVELTARPAKLPPFKGDAIGGQLPLYTAQYANQLSRQLPGFQLGDEGKARLNKAPGYQISYTSGPAGNTTFGREVWVMPKADEPDQTVVVKMRQTFSGRP